MDREFPGHNKRRVVIDAAERTITFVNCHWPNRFLAKGYDGHYVCTFDGIRSVRAFGIGSARRLFISTQAGRCAISPDWEGCAELQEALQRIATVSEGARWQDDPRILFPVMFVLIFGIVGGIIWWLL